MQLVLSFEAEVGMERNGGKKSKSSAGDEDWRG